MMNAYPDFLVRIGCVTYNHALYIEDAMNGFCMQQTTFPFVATIIDDASIDGEPEVIRRYIDAHFDLSEEGLCRQWETDDAYFIYAQHRENKNCYFAVVLLKYNFWQAKKSKAPLIKDWKNTKYVALCEGDDYWIAKDKLQRQIDFLKQHPYYSMCFHRAIIKYENPNLKSYTVCDKVEEKDYGGSELFTKWIVPTASMVMKSSIFSYPLKGYDRVLNGDIIVVLRCAELGNIRGISTPMSVYRVHEGGITYRQNDKKERYFKYPEHLEFILDNFTTVDRNRIKKELGCRFKERALNETFYTKEWFNDMAKSLKYSPLNTSKYIFKMFFLHIKKMLS